MKHKRKILMSLIFAMLFGMIAFVPSPAKATPVEEYNVWVQGEQITSDNMGNVLGDGKVSFTPAKGSEPAVLKLDGANIEEADISAVYPHVATAGIYSKIPLNIELANNSVNIVKNVNDTVICFGIKIEGNSKIFGKGQLDCSTVVNNYGAKADAIIAEDLEIEEGTINVTGGYYGISCNKIKINSGTTTAKALSRAIDATTYDLDEYVYREVLVSLKKDGSNAEKWDGITSLAYYKWIKVALKPGSPTTHNLTLTAGTGGTISADKTSPVNSGETVTVTVIPDANKEIDEFKVNGTPTTITDNEYSFVIDKDMNIEVTFKDKGSSPTTHNLTLTAGTGGTISADKTSPVNSGETVTVTVIPDANKEIDEFKVNGTPTTITDNEYSFVIDKDMNIEVTFKDKISPPPGTATVTLNPTNLDIIVGQKGLISATVKPDTAPDKSLTWNTSDPSIATVDDGIVTAHKVGSVIISVTTVDGNEAKVVVNVTGGDQPHYPPQYPPYPQYPQYPPYNPYYPPYNPYYPAPKVVVEKPVTTVTPIKETKSVDNVRIIKLHIGDKTILRTIGTDKSQINMDVAPFIENGRTMVPIRFVAEALGYKVSWDRVSREATLKSDKHTIIIPVDTNIIKVDGKTYQADVKPIIKDQRTYLSISNVCKALGLRENKDIFWDKDNFEVTIIMDK